HCRPPHLPSFPTRRSSDLSGVADPGVRGTETTAEYVRGPPTPGTFTTTCPTSVASNVVSGRRSSKSSEYVRPDSSVPRSVRNFRSEEHTSELQSLTNLVCR